VPIEGYFHFEHAACHQNLLGDFFDIPFMVQTFQLNASINLRTRTACSELERGRGPKEKNPQFAKFCCYKPKRKYKGFMEKLHVPALNKPRLPRSETFFLITNYVGPLKMTA
jgi:hypothetical protein